MVLLYIINFLSCSEKVVVADVPEYCSVEPMFLSVIEISTNCLWVLTVALLAIIHRYTAMYKYRTIVTRLQSRNSNAGISSLPFRTCPKNNKGTFSLQHLAATSKRAVWRQYWSRTRVPRWTPAFGSRSWT